MLNHISDLNLCRISTTNPCFLLRHASTPASWNRGVPHVFGELTDLSSFRDAAEGIDMAGLTSIPLLFHLLSFCPPPFNITPSS
ncbi:hypothetical protein CEXT_625881 [Caerostris extrusa]|uniref:Uncharacterized protein n=1 Tax=Caerostris extrusa TaxID=172846 RepID=A0AAV4XNF9_CAEEX|nr:hypothetical protein CEXT_625881 [Caerostris extrusa]